MLPVPRRSRWSYARALAGVATVAAVAAALLAQGCARKADDLGRPVASAKPEQVQAATVSMWRSQFETHRAQWDAEIAQSPDSPLPEERRAAFTGLRFYAFDPQWRYVGDLQRLRPPAFIEIPDTKGKGQAYLDYGRFPVERGGVVVTLEVYRPVDHPDQFFVPFFDSTNGGDTYKGGRYVHLDSLDVHRFVLDFNKAYNPYCAYDESWICPIPPRENALPFAVRAGMMAVEKP